MLFVHSSLSSIGNVEAGAETVIESLRAAVGVQGAILMPVYGTAEAALKASRDGQPVDLRTERSQTGKISEAFRRMSGVLRSSHPFSSVCALGAKADYLTNAHHADERICHRDSPLARFLELDGKVVGLGVSLGPVSFYHVLEDTWDGFPFNTYQEAPELTYIDVEGNQVTRRVAYYNRDLAARRIDSDGGLSVKRFMTEHFKKKGLLHTFRYGSADSWWFSAREVFEELKTLANSGLTIYAHTEREDAKAAPYSIVRS